MPGVLGPQPRGGPAAARAAAAADDEWPFERFLYRGSTYEGTTGIEAELAQRIFSDHGHLYPPGTNDEKRERQHLAFVFMRFAPCDSGFTQVMHTPRSGACTKHLFKSHVRPVLASLAASMDYIHYDLRLAHDNHSVAFPSRFTAIVDTYPVLVAVADKDASAALYQPKYKADVIKVETAIDLKGNLLFHLFGFAGTMHDMRVFQANCVPHPPEPSHPLLAWELWLGDKAYMHLPQVLTKSLENEELTPADAENNKAIDFIRSRVEQIIGLIKRRFAVMTGTWTRSVELLADVVAIAGQVQQLYTLIHGERFPAYGNWAHNI